MKPPYAVISYRLMVPLTDEEVALDMADEDIGSDVLERAAQKLRDDGPDSEEIVDVVVD